MDRHTPPAASLLRKVVFIAIAGSVFVAGASAQQLDSRQLSRSSPAENGQPFQSRSPLLVQQDTGFEVPPLVERPLGLEEGPRVRVSRFQLEGAMDRPDVGIRVAELQAMLRTQEAAQPPNGYTVNQLGEVADLLTRYYREHGLILAQAYVPAQQVNGGVVRLAVMEGTLGAVGVEGNAMYTSNAISEPFSRLRGQPVVESEIEAALLTLQEFPGLTVFGTFRAGSVLGETELLVQVRDEDRVSFTPMGDNYGTDSTGQMRAAIQFAVNNPFNANDRISGYALQTFDPKNGVYGGLDYEKRSRSGRSALGFGAARNTFDVTDATTGFALDLSGEVEQANLMFRNYFSRGRFFRSSGTIDLAYRDAITNQPGDDPEDELNVFSYTFDFFGVGRARRSINIGSFRAVYGDNQSLNPSRILDGGIPVTDEFASYSKFEVNFQRLQRMSQRHSLLFRMDGQYTSDPLVALEQYALGGPANVRAYPVAEGLVDSGGSATLEYIINAPGFADKTAGTNRNGIGRNWGEIFQLSFFYDYAEGHINEPLPLQDPNVRLKGYGIGMQFSQSDSFFIRLDFAKPEGGPGARNGDRTQMYFSFSYTF